LDVINLEIPQGIYLVDVLWGKKKYKGLMHFGYRSTYHDSISTEVIIANFNEDIYGQDIKITVHKKIRNIVEFDSPEALKEQIAKDMEYLK